MRWWLVVLLAAFAPAVSGSSAPEDATASLQQFHDALLDVMRSNQAHAHRVVALTEPINRLFDFETISRISVGRTWSELGNEERAEFQQLLAALVTATYADRFQTYAGQAFATLDAVQTPTGVVVVSELSRPNGPPVRLDYYFRGGRVFNVVADGVSDLSLRRADYASIIKQQGYDALLEQIRESIDQYATDS